MTLEEMREQADEFVEARDRMTKEGHINGWLGYLIAAVTSQQTAALAERLDETNRLLARVVALLGQSPWTCGVCGHQNGPAAERCGSCNRYPNGEKP